MTPHAPRVLCYSHDTFGLGHIRRTVSICEALTSNLPGAAALVLTGSSSMQALRTAPGIDFVKLPSVTKVADERYESKFLDMHVESIRAMREEIILSTASAFHPTTLIVDNVPLGMMGELRRTLEHLRRQWPRPHVILTMRDIVDEPGKVIEAWKRQGVHDALDRYYDDILVYGMPEVFDFVREYDLPARVADKVQYAGYIERGIDVAAAAEVRRRLAPHGHRLILVTVGGGGDGARLVETYLRGVVSTRPGTQHHLVVLGPDMPDTDRQAVRQRYGVRRDVTLLDYCDHLTSCMAAADVVVAMGGYNTMCEILALRKPAVIVPRVAPRLEQWIRCSRMADLGLVRVVHPDDLTPSALWSAIHEALDGRAFQPLPLRFSGLHVVSDLVRSSHAMRTAIGA